MSSMTTFSKSSQSKLDIRGETLQQLRASVSSSAKMVADTRQLNQGDIFLAYPVGRAGAMRDGRPYIDQAIKKGAGAILFDPKNYQYANLSKQIPFLAVENLANQAGFLSSEWYGNPSHQINVIGVTGTNGKTSVTQWLSQTLDTEKKAAVMGTLGIGFPGRLYSSGYTTPDAPRVQTELKQLVDQGANYLAMEVSSHALDQGRVNGVQFACSVFTNLSQDHLDYHGSMLEYGNAKAKLFYEHSLKKAVLNLDDAFGKELAAELLRTSKVEVWAYALNPTSLNEFQSSGSHFHHISLRHHELVEHGYNCHIQFDTQAESLMYLPVLGEFNLSNGLAVIATLLAQGLSLEEVRKRVARLQAVSGRMEMIGGDKENAPLVVVDYAHTPDALEKSLQALRPLANQRQGNLWCVFGCGGDRDSSKRPLMGKVAQTFADYVVITSDNPRSENPDDIIQMISKGMSDSANSNSVQLIADRAAAIMLAIRHANPKDIVLVAGKGHESTQEVNGTRFEFSDQAHIQLILGGSSA